MDQADWWREWLGVPDRSRWYVSQSFAWHNSGGYEHGTLTVGVADGTAIECGVVSPLDAPWQGPIVLVPFYRVGYVTGRGDARRYGSPEAAWRRAFASHLVDRGMTAVVVPWWFESIVDENATGLAGRYRPAVAEHVRRHSCTGLGRSIADLVAVLDALDRVPAAHSPYGCFGHSLGGKLTMFLAALDDRVSVSVACEPGLGWAHSNWSDPWYVDDRIPDGRDHDELLAAIPPRRVLLITGEASDGEHNADLVQSARGRAGAMGDRIEVLGHDEGHTPPHWVLDEAYGWLGRQLRSGN